MKHSSRTIRLLLIPLAVAAALAGVEAWLRLFPPTELARVTNMHPFLHHDPLLGFTMEPNLRRVILSEDGQTEYSVETNEDGLREPSYEGRGGRRVILGLGDSTLFGDGVKREDSLMSRLQQTLDARRPGLFRAVNAGMLGYAVNQEVLYYVTRGDARFDPDVVVLFFNASDFMIPTFWPPRYHEGVPIPDLHSTYNQNKKPESDRFEWQTWKLLKLRFGATVQTKLATFRPTMKLPYDVAQFNRENAEHLESEAHRTVIRDTLRSFKEKAEANGARVLIAYLPEAKEVTEGRARDNIYRRYAYSRTSWDWDMPARRLRAHLNDIGIPFVNLTPALREHAKKTGRTLHINGEGHLTAEGHQVAAEALEPMIMDVLEGRPPREIESVRNNARPGTMSFSQPAGRTARAAQGASSAWAAAQGVVRDAVVYSGSHACEVEQPLSAADLPKFIRIFVHPQSGDFDLSFTFGQQPPARETIRLPAGTQMWRGLDIPVPTVTGASDVFRLTVQPLTPGRPAVFAEPEKIFQRSARRPPILLLTADMLRADQLTVYGSTTGTHTPGLNALAKDAVVFDDATTASSSAVASMISLLTGVDPYTHMVVRGSHTHADLFPTLASILKSAGYTSAAFTDHAQITHLNIPGFNAYTEFVAAAWANHSARMNASIRDWIRNHRDESFFMLCRTGVELDAAAGGRTSPDADAAKRIRGIDEFVGTLTAALRTEGLYDDAMIIFAGLNGDPAQGASSSAGARRGWNVRQEMLHVPLIVKLPGRVEAERGGHVTRAVGLVDVAPTIIDVLGAAMPDILDGEPLTRLMKKGHEPDSSASTAETADRMFLIGGIMPGPADEGVGGMRWGPYKAIILEPDLNRAYQSGFIQLYDLARDPKEERDLAVTAEPVNGRTAEDIWETFRTVASFRMKRSSRPVTPTIP